MCKFELVEVFQGDKAAIYSVLLNDSEDSLFEDFVEKYIDDYPNEIKNIIDRFKVMAFKTGAREQYFKIGEGRATDAVVAVCDLPDKNFRLYCIRLGSCTVIIGGGSLKHTRTYQDDLLLYKEVQLMMRVEKIIVNSIRNKEIIINNDGSLSGCLRMEDDL
jgi:hypothetical protein